MPARPFPPIPIPRERCPDVIKVIDYSASSTEACTYPVVRIKLLNDSDYYIKCIGGGLYRADTGEQIEGFVFTAAEIPEFTPHKTIEIVIDPERLYPTYKKELMHIKEGIGLPLELRLYYRRVNTPELPAKLIFRFDPTKPKKVETSKEVLFGVGLLSLIALVFGLLLIKK